MKSKLLFSLSIFTSILSWAQIPTQGLIAFYPFDGNLNVKGTSNSFYNLTATGNVEFAKGRSGEENCAIYTFGSGGGVTAYASSGNGPSVGGGNFALSFWFKADASGYSTGSVYSSGCFSQGFPQSPTFVCGNGGGVVASKDKLDHYVYLKKGDTIYLYKNSAPVCKYKPTTTVCLTTQAVTIGRNLGGFLDDMRIYERALSVEEIAALSQEVSSCDVATRIEESNLSVPFTILPNPSNTGDFEIQSSETISKIEAFDMKGKAVNLIVLSPASFSIAEQGVYIVKLYSASGTRIVKAIVE
jgi:hypothetical protein